MIAEIYVENNVGREVTETINRFSESHGISAVFQHNIHPEMQRSQNGDEWWIKDIAGRGMAILTQDNRILGLKQLAQGTVTDERQAIIDSRAHVFALGKADYSIWDKMRCVARSWEVILRLLSEPGPQAATLLLSETRIESFE